MEKDHRDLIKSSLLKAEENYNITLKLDREIYEIWFRIESLVDSYLQIWMNSWPNFFDFLNFSRLEKALDGKAEKNLERPPVIKPTFPVPNRRQEKFLIEVIELLSLCK